LGGTIHHRGAAASAQRDDRDIGRDLVEIFPGQGCPPPDASAVDSGFTIAQAIAVRGDQYVAVGTDAAIRPLAGANTRLVDIKGSAVTPGLSDNHDHLYNSAKVMRGIDLVGATSAAEVVRRLRDGFAKGKPGETVFACSPRLGVPTSLDQEVGEGLGAQARQRRLTEVIWDGGFSRIRRATEGPFNMVLEARA
jgi:hypothetical protein